MPTWLLFSVKGFVSVLTIAVFGLLVSNVQTYHVILSNKRTMAVLYVSICFALLLNIINVWTDLFLDANLATDEIEIACIFFKYLFV